MTRSLRSAPSSGLSSLKRCKQAKRKHFISKSPLHPSIHPWPMNDNTTFALMCVRTFHENYFFSSFFLKKKIVFQIVESRGIFWTRRLPTNRNLASRCERCERETTFSVRTAFSGRRKKFIKEFFCVLECFVFHVVIFNKHTTTATQSP